MMFSSSSTRMRVSLLELKEFYKEVWAKRTPEICEEGA